MRRLLNGLYALSAGLAALSIFAICSLMIWQSLARIVGWPTAGTNDVVAWLCAAAAFLGMAGTFKHGDFVRVTFVTDQLKPGARRALEAISLLVALAAVGFLAWWATVFTHESYALGEMAPGMIAIPLWMPQVTFVLGAWILLAAIVDEAFIVIVQGREPTYAVAIAERHARGDFSSDI